MIRSAREVWSSQNKYEFDFACDSVMSEIESASRLGKRRTRFKVPFSNTWYETVKTEFKNRGYTFCPTGHFWQNAEDICW